jgi:hypothetical protein
MNKSSLALILLAVFLLTFPAGAEDKIPPDSRVRIADCPVQKISNETFEASLWPVRQEPGNEWVAFRLSIHNLTDKPLSIAWNDTFYVRNGENDGGFKFEDETFTEKCQIRQPETIPPGGNLSKVIWPESRFYNGGKDIGWFVMPIATGEGQNGVSLALKTDTRDIREMIALNIDNQARVCGLKPIR